MKKLILALGLISLLIGNAYADTFYLWRYRNSSTDCTALTDGKERDLCYEEDSRNLYKCDPTSGDCDTSGEWKLITTDAFNKTEILALANLTNYPNWTTANTTYASLGAVNAFDAFNQTFDTTVLKIDAVNNRVGIGTATPGMNLEVVDATVVGNTNNNTQLIARFEDGGSRYFDVAAIRKNDNTTYRYSGIRLKESSSDSAVANQWIDMWIGVNTVDNYIAFGEGNTTEWMRIANGLVGIAQPTPTTLLDILGANDTTIVTLKINDVQANVTATDTYIDFRSTTGSEGSIAGTASAGVLAYNTFTGSHYTQVIDKEGLEPNVLLEIVEGKPYFLPQMKIEIEEYEEERGIKKQREIERIYHSSSKEQLWKTQICQTRKSKKAIGVYGGTDKEGRDLCLSIGTGFMWVVNKGKDLEIGDYLISSDIKGCVEKQEDDIYRSYTVGKIAGDVKWNEGEKKRLVKVIYLGG